jgi:hypothetical protein
MAERTQAEKLDAIAKIICDWPNSSSNDKRNARITAAAVLKNLEDGESNGFPSGTVQSEVRVPSDQSLGIRPMDRRRPTRPDTQQARRRRSWRP